MADTILPKSDIIQERARAAAAFTLDALAAAIEARYGRLNDNADPITGRRVITYTLDEVQHPFLIEACKRLRALPPPR